MMPCGTPNPFTLLLPIPLILMGVLAFVLGLDLDTQRAEIAWYLLGFCPAILLLGAIVMAAITHWHRKHKEVLI